MIRASANDLKLYYSRWEQCDLNWILKPWNDEAFHWMIFEGEYDKEKMVIFDKTDTGVNAIPFQYWVPPQYLIMGRA